MNLYKIPTHPDSPVVVNAIVEIPKGTSVKYEYDGDLELFKMDRMLCSAMTYPASYGFIPNTLAEDNDPLDIVIYNSLPINTGALVECNVLGVLDMIDKGEKDWKVIAAPTSHIKNYKDISDIDDTFLKVCKNFFAHYKDLNGTSVSVLDWHDKQFAYDIVESCVK
jgi:inorganic pyrophosphatase